MTKLTDILSATPAPRREDVMLPSSGRSARVSAARRSFPAWTGEPPLLPYSDWNKRYWLSFRGRPANAETYVRQLIEDAGMEARWVTPVGAGWFSFRLEPKRPALDPSADAPMSPAAHAVILRVHEEALRLLERRRSIGQPLRDSAGKPVTRGGCWDVVAWDEKP